jgi:hypothetical protein
MWDSASIFEKKSKTKQSKTEIHRKINNNYWKPKKTIDN